MAIAYVGGNQTAQWGGTSAATLAFPAYTATAGNCLIVFFTWDESNTATVTVTDDKSNTWTVVKPLTDGGQGITFAYATNVAAGSTTVTVHFGVSESYRMGQLVEFSGVAGVTPADGANAQSQEVGSVGVVLTSTAFTTTADGDLILGGFVDSYGGNGTYTASSGFTIRQTQPNMAVESMVQATHGSIAGTATYSAAGGWSNIMAIALKAATGGGGAAITATGTVGLGGSAALKGGIAAAGGIALAGAAALRAPVTAAGTITLGGAAKLGGGIAGSSTIALAGAGALKGGLAAAGGIGLGGAAVLGAPGGAIVATGGLTLAGAAALRAPIAAAGTITLGGAADLRTRSTMQASGIITLGGAAALRGALAAAGTIMLGGQAILFAGGSGDEMDEAEFWAQASGLAPLRDYSVEEHQLAAMRVRLSRTDGSLDDVAPIYYGGIGYTGTIDEMEHAFWANLAGLSSTDAYDSPMPDVKALALAAGPAVP